MSDHSLLILAFGAKVVARKMCTNPRKSALQKRSRVTVDALLEATARILIREGFDKASTNRIAEVAGVSVGSLYQYFPNKEALIVCSRSRFRVWGGSRRWIPSTGKTMFFSQLTLTAIGMRYVPATLGLRHLYA
jgi:hypothetical protein